MTRLFLASAFGKIAHKLPWGLLENAKNRTVAFIPTAANPYEDAWWMEEDKKKLQELGFVVREITIEDKDSATIRSECSGCDVIFVAGGNTFYLLYHLRKSGFDAVLKELIDAGVPYIGSSAGSVVLGPTLEPVYDLEESVMVPELTSYDALHVINTVILPHTGSDFGMLNKKIQEDFSGRGYSFILLTDTQALVVEDKNEVIINA